MNKFALIGLIGLTGLVFSSNAVSEPLWSHIYQNSASQGASIAPDASAPWQKVGIAKGTETVMAKPSLARNDSAPWSHISPSSSVVDIAVMEIVPEKK